MGGSGGSQGPWRAPAFDPQRELRDHGDREFWRAGIAAIAAREGLGGTPVEPFASGSDVVWRVGEAVVKWTAPRWGEQMDREARVLEHLDGRLTVRTPAVLARGELDGWPYLVQRRLPGRALGEVWPGLDAAERLRLAGDLGALCRELHDAPPPPESPPFTPFWEACRRDPTARHAGPAAAQALVGELEPFLARLGELPRGPEALLHTELLGDHVLLERRAGGFVPSALIDLADARPGAPELELAAPVEFVFRGEPGLLAAFLRAYGWRERNGALPTPECALAYGLLHPYGRLARALDAAGGAGRPAPASLRDLARALYGDLDASAPEPRAS